MFIQPAQTDWDTFYENLNRRTGLDLKLYRPEQLQRRLLTILRSRGFESLDEFWRFLNIEPSNIPWLLDRLAINVSELYRNPEKWVELRRAILPQMLKRSEKLKVWSAGCSFGAEAYTLGVVLQQLGAGDRAKIIGTDIDEAALAMAREGAFTDSDMRAVPADVRYKYFSRSDDGKWIAGDAIRKNIEFRKGNLLRDRYDNDYDLILCRNVVIYFTDETKKTLFNKFFHALKPGGILFVGSTERIFNAEAIGFETPLPFFYQKPYEEGKWQNAS
ncbi:MAG: protein-glutamate O-methyltransferase CheR [Armatimonadetes bacterium]|nr:protein-glutamate O-methyltransferase CheR [Armatimonadota bacterium]